MELHAWAQGRRSSGQDARPTLHREKRVESGQIGARFCGFVREMLMVLMRFDACKTVQKRAETCQKRAETVKKREKAVKKRVKAGIARRSRTIRGTSPRSGGA